jgi:hypothetical protein
MELLLSLFWSCDCGRLCFLCRYSSLMMEAARTSETSVDNDFTWQYIPEDNSERDTYLFAPCSSWWRQHKPQMLKVIGCSTVIYRLQYGDIPVPVQQRRNGNLKLGYNFLTWGRFLQIWGKWDDNVDGVKLSLNCGHQLFIPQVVYEYGEPRWNYTDRGKLLILPPERSLAILLAEAFSSKLGVTWRMRWWI